MKNDYISLFKSFVYAFRGIFWMVSHERNFRIHLSCMAYMLYYLLRYDFFSVSRTEFAVLLLACALVLGGELINTGIEKSDDTITRETRRTIKISKDTAAGAVLVFAIFAVAVGVAVLWQPEAFSLLFLHYRENPLCILMFVLSVVACTLFIFKFDFNKKENKSDE